MLFLKKQIRDQSMDQVWFLLYNRAPQLMNTVPSRTRRKSYYVYWCKRLVYKTLEKNK